MKGILELARAAQMRQPKAKIYVCGIMPRRAKEKRIAELNNHLQNHTLEAGFSYIDLTNRLVKEDGSIKEELFVDGLHPNEEGYKEEALMLEKAVNE